MDLEPLIRRPFPQVPQIFLVELFERIEVGNKERIRLEFRGVINQSRRLPTQGAHGEVVEAEFDVPPVRRRS